MRCRPLIEMLSGLPVAVRRAALGVRVVAPDVEGDRRRRSWASAPASCDMHRNWRMKRSGAIALGAGPVDEEREQPTGDHEVVRVDARARRPATAFTMVR